MMKSDQSQAVDIQALSRHRLNVIFSTVCLSIASVIWVSLILSQDDLFDSAYFLPSQMVLGVISIWNIVACILLMLAMRTHKAAVILVGFLALFLGWIIGIALIIRSSIKIINTQNQQAQQTQSTA